jgi:hypothetical protein
MRVRRLAFKHAAVRTGTFAGRDGRDAFMASA